MTVIPKWGQPHVVPEDAIAAWGARLIVDQFGEVDMLPDRQGGDEGEHSDSLYEELDARFPMPVLKGTIGDLLRGYDMQIGQREDFIIFMDDRVVVHANANASYGYCYVTAWLYKEDS